MRVIASTKQFKSYLFGVAGGSGSGKTYFAQAVRQALGKELCTTILQDSFYIDQSAKFDRDGGAVNFDHPDSIDFQLLAQCLKAFKGGNSFEVPIYDFATHKRLPRKTKVEPKPIVIVDGILLLHFPEVRELFDDTVYFDTPEDLRFKRRMDRDVRERGRTARGVTAQFQNQVKPMHDQFVEPSKLFAKKIIKDEGKFDGLLSETVASLQKKMESLRIK